jgi:hypothetical protein
MQSKDKEILSRIGFLAGSRVRILQNIGHLQIGFPEATGYPHVYGHPLQQPLMLP